MTEGVTFQLSLILTLLLFHHGDCVCECKQYNDVTVTCTGCSSMDGMEYPAIPQLEQLNISNNHLKEVTNIPCTDLSSLDLSYNVIEGIQDKVFDTCTWLEHLNISHNQLLTLSMKDFYGLNSVQTLDLSYNHIVNLTDGSALDDMRLDLEWLNLSHNQIQFMHKGLLKNMKNLKYLDLSVNYIWEIGDSHIEGLFSLQTLNLRHNLVKVIHANAFLDLERLKFLDLGFNNLKSIELKAFRGLERNLSTLLLDHNQILHIGGVLKYISHLERLSLDNNPIQSFFSHGFPATLRQISVSHCYKLQALHPFTFAGLRRLTEVRISHNDMLTEIEPGTFDADLVHLSSVDLSNNKLKTLSVTLLPWATIDNLNLGGNAWSCDCRLHWLQSKRPDVAETMICKSPEAMCNMTLSNVTFTDEPCVPRYAGHYFFYIIVALGLGALVVVVSVFVLRWYRKKEGIYYKSLVGTGSVQYRGGDAEVVN